MKKITSLLVLIFSIGQIHAQGLTAPVAEGVYGGLVGDIESWAFDSDSVYCVVSTYSPNSIFWAKASRNSARTNLAWEPLQSADADDGFGSSVLNIEIHQASNTIFFLSQGTEPFVEWKPIVQQGLFGKLIFLIFPIIITSSSTVSNILPLAISSHVFF